MEDVFRSTMPTLRTRPSVVIVVMVIVVPVVMVMVVVIIVVPPASPFASGARVFLPLAILFFVICSVIIVAHFAVTPHGVFVNSAFFGGVALRETREKFHGLKEFKKTDVYNRIQQKAVLADWKKISKFG